MAKSANIIAEYLKKDTFQSRVPVSGSLFPKSEVSCIISGDEKDVAEVRRKLMAYERIEDWVNNQEVIYPPGDFGRGQKEAISFVRDTLIGRRE